MGLETGTYINGLDPNNPLGSDPKSAGDDHIRLIKSTIKNTFPNITGAVTPTQTELNYVAGVTSSIQTQLNGKQPAGNYQPLDSDLTAIAALTTEAFGRSLLTQADAAAARSVLGAASDATVQTIWIPAGAMTPRTTNGAAMGLIELPTNKVMVKTLDFDATLDKFAQFSVRMPKGWNEGTITAVFRWSHGTTASNFDVVWGIQAVAVSDDDAMDVAFGTAQTVTDTGGTENNTYETAATSAVTIAGSPAEGDMVIFQVYRDADASADTLAIAARLHGVVINYTTTSLSDA